MYRCGKIVDGRLKVQDHDGQWYDLVVAAKRYQEENKYLVNLYR